MGNRKIIHQVKYFITFLLLCSLSVTAQRVKPFAGFSLYLDTDFEQSGFVGANLGVEFKIKHYFKPEIETSILFGRIQNRTLKDGLGNDSDLFVSNVYAINFSFSPKICLGDEQESGTSFVSIRPKYNFSRIQSNGSHFIIDKDNPLKSVEEKDEYIEWRHSFGIGLGFDLYLSDNNSNSIAFILYYQGIEMGNALSKLKFSTLNYATKDVLGLGITYYIGIKNKE